MKTEMHKILNDAINKWGRRAQLEMMQEEAIELAMAARKHIRKDTPETYGNLAEEIADVEILIEQVKIMFPNIQSRINENKVFKLERLEKRLLENNFEA